MRLADLAVPRSDAAARALEVAIAFSSPALVNHCRRSYLWAAAYGDAHGIAYDAEMLYVSAMLHDVGLTPAFDNHAVPFEVAGGSVAWVFTAGAGWPVARRRRAAEVIERHMWDAVDVAQDAEGFLLEIATGLDISGRNPALVAGRATGGGRGGLPAAGPRRGVHRLLRCRGGPQAREHRRRRDEGRDRDRIAANVLDLDPGRDA